MNRNQAKIEEIIRQEEELCFDRFGSEDALRLGQILIGLAKEAGVCYVVNISLNRRQLFHFSPDGVTPDNDNWARRKENTVYHFFRSSYRVTLELEDSGEQLCPRFGLSDADYVAAGGSFPIHVRGAGVVGAVTISGLPQEEDHAFVTKAIKQYLDSLA
ncbi:heme-degrading domain-containing protein [Butyricicoccus sp. 1XD8-22]|nr:heme-degrading domain-containing protein [Butyricicoccus sp. 1XD8-22]